MNEDKPIVHVADQPLQTFRACLNDASLTFIEALSMAVVGDYSYQINVSPPMRFVYLDLPPNAVCYVSM